jgi:two-component system phosphate regulon response regulator PhoB
MSRSLKTLIVEDEADVRDLLTLHLRRENLDVTPASHGEEALELLARVGFELLVLDWMLPGASGVDLCRKVRAGHGLAKPPGGRPPAILMVTAKVDPADIVTGLEAGADDYVTKPFEIPVLLARVRALMRRLELVPMAEQAAASQLKLEGLLVDFGSHRVFCEGQEIALTPSEFKLLSALLESRGRVLARDQLIGLVQGKDVNVVKRTIDTHVYGLRKKLGPCGDLIETLRGVGYRVKG